MHELSWLNEAQLILDKRLSINSKKTKKNLYLIYYKDEHLSDIEPEYNLINNTGIQDVLLEFSIFEKFLKNENNNLSEWGIFSWKFKSKTKLNYSQVSNFIENSEKSDLIYFSPPLEEEIIFENPWIQGFIAHPGLDIIVDKIFKMLSIDGAYLKIVYPFDAISYCNYFYGNKKFWTSYIQFIRLVINFVDTRLPHNERNYIYTGGGSSTNAHGTKSFMPFIIERFSSLYLLIMKEKMKITKCDIRTFANIEMNPKNSVMMHTKKAMNYCEINSPQYSHLEKIFHILKKSK
jgi:hypothetical protein